MAIQPESELWEYDPLESDPSEEDESDLKDVRTEAVVTATDWTVETILSQLNRGNIELNPDFQRREVWDNKRKSKFIESLILGLPVPQIILAERQNDRGKYIVLDGKQRLLALLRFGLLKSQGDLEPLTLSDLQIKDYLNGKDWSDLQDDPQFEKDVNAYENQTIRTVVVRNWPDDKFLHLVFYRLNTETVPLSPQELRHAIYRGPFVDFAERYSLNSDSLKKALRLSGPDFRMRDVEILLRFLAFVDSIGTYRGDLKDFLDALCKKFNKEWESRQSEIKELLQQCDNAIDATFDVFQNDAFRRWRAPDRFEGRFNRAIFDIMTYYFRDPEIAKQASQNRNEVVDAFKELCSNDQQFNLAIQSTTKSTTATYYRLRKWGETLELVLKRNVNIPHSLYRAG